MAAHTSLLIELQEAIERGSSDRRIESLRSVAANEGASLSPAGFEALAASAENDHTLGERMVRRADVPPHVFCTLLTRATEEVRQRFIAAARPEMHGEIRRVLDVVSGEIAER